MTLPESMLNRPMLASDLETVVKSESAAEVRKLARAYRDAGLPVMNGGFTYSNLREDRAQMLTCSPYRLWEYTSLLQALEGRDCNSFIDVGGAGSPLPYWLAERGLRGTAVDLQPMLVEICNSVARARNLPLHAVAGDVTTDFRELNGAFDLVTCVSVVEHIPAAVRAAAVKRFFELLRPGGLLYLTFDYGTFRDMQSYGSGKEGTAAIDDATAFAEMLVAAGFRFVGNDPRELPDGILSKKSSPGVKRTILRYALNFGPIDADTPWIELVKYIVKRVFRYTGRKRSRFDSHNFFRMVAERPE